MFDNLRIKENKDIKICTSKDYNFIFNKHDGTFYRWGKTKENDPLFAPSAEIADIEISSGKCIGCSFCYKDNSNLAPNVYMSFERYKQIFNKINVGILTQIAFGITTLDSNPDLWKIMKYTRDNGVIPNITINGYNTTNDDIIKLASICGAVAVSHYNDDNCFNTIKKLTDAGLKQVNIHKLLSSQTYDECLTLVDKIKNDKRLEKLNAIVFLTLKPKGKRNHYTSISFAQYSSLIKKVQQSGINFGLDSCGAPMLLKVIEKTDQISIVDAIDPCESSLFSIYIDVTGTVYPCSFSVGQGEWKNGITIDQQTDFIKDIWLSEKINKWRGSLIASSDSCLCSMKKYCRKCPIFNITNCIN